MVGYPWLKDGQHQVMWWCRWHDGNAMLLSSFDDAQQRFENQPSEYLNLDSR